MNKQNVAAVETARKVTTFTSEQYGKLRTVGTGNEALFCLADICNTFGYSNPSGQAEKLDRSKIYHVPIRTTNGVRLLLFINKSNFLYLLTKINTAYAQEYRRWVRENVIPVLYGNKPTQRTVTPLAALEEAQRTGYIAITPDTAKAFVSLLRLEQCYNNLVSDLVNIYPKEGQEEMADGLMEQYGAMRCAVMEQLVYNISVESFGRMDFKGI